MANTGSVSGDGGLFTMADARVEAQYEHEKTEGNSSKDDGSYRTFQSLVDAGLIEPFRIRNVRYPLALVRTLFGRILARST